jgi:hypothetical protein
MSERAVYSEPVIVLAAAVGVVLMASPAAMVDDAFAFLGSCAVPDAPPPQDLEPAERQ